MVAYLIVLIFVGMHMKAIEIQAHRGSRFKQPENTIAAFKQAIIDGADSIECDVQVSADNIVFFAHDTLFDGKAIKYMNYDEVLALRCGQGDYRLYPLLDDVFRVFDNQVFFDIEIKSDSNTYAPEFLVEATVAVVRGRGYTDMRLRSFDSDVVRYIKKHYPHIECALLTDRGEYDSVQKAVSVGAEIVAPHYSTVTKDMILCAHAKKLKVMPWTVNDIADALKFIELGIDGITTDYPDRIAEYFMGIEIE